MTGVTACDTFKTANLSLIFLYFISLVGVSDRCDRLKLRIDRMIKERAIVVIGRVSSGEFIKTTCHTCHTCHWIVAELFSYL